ACWEFGSSPWCPYRKSYPPAHSTESSNGEFGNTRKETERRGTRRPLRHHCQPPVLRRSTRRPPPSHPNLTKKSRFCASLPAHGDDRSWQTLPLVISATRTEIQEPG